MPLVKMPGTEAIAVIGMSGRFPGAGGVEDFWRNIQNGIESISHFTDDELQVFDSATIAAQTGYVKARGILANVDQFDAAFFGMAPEEAEVTDPQHRVFLECCWEAFENAGYDPLTYAKNAAVFAGCSTSTYFLEQICATRNFIRKYTAAYQASNFSIVAGNNTDFLATRVSSTFNFKGPSYTISCGHSTSLVAVSQACQSLLAHQCDAALAGGVSVTFPQIRGYLYDSGNALSPDGHCKPFDASAQGTVFGSGVAVVLLKRLSEAIQDGDQIYAVIRGSAVNNDGFTKDDFAALGVEGQSAVVALAMASAGIRPETVNYIEANGTGIRLDDRLEVAALKKVFRRSMESRNLCALGTAKANVGHLDVASGAAGLIKACLMLRDKKMPPHLHFKSPNPAMDLENSPFYINTELTEWPRGHSPRRAGVSAFGEGGTNAHVVLEEAPARWVEQSARSSHLVLISAKSEQALERACENLVQFLTETTVPLADTAYTLQIGRHAFNHRRLAVCCDQADTIEVFSNMESGRVSSGIAPASPPSIAFLFPGQGSQQVQMGYDLYRTEACFREQMDRCSEILRPHLDLHLTDILYPLESYKGRAAQQLNQTILAQPAIFALEYSLARLWMQWGIAPLRMIGHGTGEYVAACLAGVISLEDALMLMATRGRLMQQIPAGEMLSVRLAAHALVPRLNGALSIAAINGPNNCVAAGPTAAIRQLLEELKGDGTGCRRLTTSHAFHSAMMDPVIEPYVQTVRTVKLSAPSIPYISGVTGDWITAAEATDPAYWGQQLRQPVLFSIGIQNLAREGVQAVIEVGAGTMLSVLTHRNLGNTGKPIILSSLPDAESSRSGTSSMLKTLGSLWLAGSQPDWTGMYSSERRRRIHLPTYPFERKRHWLASIELDQEAANAVAVSAALDRPHAVLDAKHSQHRGDHDMTPEDALEINSKRRARIQCAVAETFEELLGINPAGANVAVTFLAMGFDVHSLTQAAQNICSKFGVRVSLGQLLDQQSTLSALTDYLIHEMPWNQFAVPAVPQVQPAVPETGLPVAALPGTLASILSDQLHAMTQLINRQLEVLQQAGVVSPSAIAPELAALHSVPGASALPPAGVLEDEHQPKPSVAVPPSHPAAAIVLTPVQETYLARFTQFYVSRTKKSKDLTQQYRAKLADSRAAAGFRMQWKEMVYPIVTEHSRGSRLWDLNGNEYIDIVNGFGPTVFGHAPDFVVNAVRSQLDRGFEIGPQSPIAGKVAAMICDMTGMERAAFCNTGSESVMAAIRVARCVTRRVKMVTFSGAYHGIFDEVLSKRIQKADGPHTVPIASGIPVRNLQNITVLEYASASSLEWIEKHAHELACVLVEPVQSHHPDLQPKEFLQELRRITTDSGAALIFDEGTTGFRVHPGGVQALFGIRADLATYGKVLGGGLPIGVLAGSAKFMDALDGGNWNYGDASFPDEGVTFVGGTFVRHPLALAAAEAVLDHLQEQGPALQERLNAKTSRLVAELNSCFADAGLASHVESFGSIFFFSFPPEDGCASLLFYHLRANGVYVLEGYPCFLTSAHTDGDVKNIAEIFRRSIREMQGGGFFPAPPEKTTVPEPFIPDALSTVPMTAAQREIWRAAHGSGIANIAFNESCSVHLLGDLDIPALQDSIAEIMARHEALRASVKADSESLRIVPALDLVFTIVDLSGLEPEERLSACQQLILEDTRTPFDLAAGPLLRTVLVRLQPDDHIFVFSTHRIICDKWSANVVLDEISKLYSAKRQDLVCQLPEVSSFSEFAFAEQLRQETADGQKTEAYWLEQFKVIPAPLELPSDRPRPAPSLLQVATCRATISAANAHQIECLGLTQGCTLFVTLLSGLHALLQRLVGRTVSVVGIPAAAQSAIGAATLVGRSIGFLPLVARTEDATTVKQFLNQTKRTLVDACDHQEYSFHTLIGKLGLVQDQGRPPLMEVLFNLEHAGAGLSFDGLAGAVKTNLQNAGDFDLFLRVTALNNGLILDCDYSTDLFDESTIRRWLGHFESFLLHAAADPTQSVQRVALMTPEETTAVLSGWSRASREYPEVRCLHEMFEEQAANNPSAVAIILEDRQLTYGELNTRANQFSRYLRKHGIGPENTVCLCVERSLSMLVGVLGILKAGGGYIALDSNGPPARLRSLLEEAQSRFIVTELALSNVFSTAGIKSICIDTDWPLIARESEQNPPPAASPDNLCCTIYTPDSSGKPKGVMLTHRHVARLFAATEERFHFEPSDVWVMSHPCASAFALWELWGCLLFGGRLVIVSPAVAASAQDFRRLLESECVTVLNQTPSAFKQLMEADQHSPAGNYLPLRLVLLSGESFSFATLKPWFDRNKHDAMEVFTMYGITETTAFASCRSIRATDAFGGLGNLIGEPLPDVELYILDRNLNPVVIGTEGELCIGGAGVARGYWNRNELTDERFVRDPYSNKPHSRLYRSGDLAKMLPDGEIEYLGRLDRQVKLRGVRVEPGEIEQALLQHAAVLEATVVVREDTLGEKRLTAYVVPTESSITVQDLRACLADSLPDYLIPTAFVLMQHLPSTPDGQVNQSALPAPGYGQRKSHEYVAPQTAGEKILAQIWAEVLWLNEVGVHDDIFDLGADPYHVLQISARAKEAGIAITPKQIQAQRTISKVLLTAGADQEETPRIRIMEKAS